MVVNLISRAVRAVVGTSEEDPPKRDQVSISYWAKRRGHSAYLSWFFGTKIQLDVAVSEIRRYHLAALLESNVPLCYFLYNLLDNYCAENLVIYFLDTLFIYLLFYLVFLY